MIELNAELLSTDESNLQIEPNLKSCINAHGLYNSIHFVLRLSPKVHQLMSEIKTGIYADQDVSWEHTQAFSTYLHENIHWWQHIGSTSGLVQSLCSPLQTLTNLDELRDFVRTCGPYKSIKQYNLRRDTYGNVPAHGAHVTNVIINNFMDIEFFRIHTQRPDLLEQVYEDPYYECAGHSYRIVYDYVVSTLDAMFDQNYSFLPNPNVWHEEFEKLKEKKITGYYYGSPIGRCPIGIRELYEGQARFIQLQYLHFGSGKQFSWDDAEKSGMFGKVYMDAFHLFLRLIEEDFPSSIDDPLVGLFLLICDIAMNPGEGFPLQIYSYESFILDTDPSVRFVHACKLIKLKLEHLKKAVQSYSKEEYQSITEEICKELITPSPSKIAKTIIEWSETKEKIIDLTTQDKTFDFDPSNIVVRVLFSKYINFCKDKIEHPEILCWPGAWLAEKNVSEESQNIFLRHVALFMDKADDDGIYPTILPDKNPSYLHQTFNRFYANCLISDLVRQWILAEGEFNFDYKWLSEKYSPKDFQPKLEELFENLFGIRPSHINTLQN